MDFFTQQEKARKKTGLLVVFFIAAVICIIAALYAAIALILKYNDSHSNLLQPELLIGVSAGVVAIILGGTLFKMQQLRRGGGAVAEMLGAVPVSADTKDLQEKKLFNVVEEMAIASGTPMPEVYVLEEDGINAFAAGWSTSDAAVCATRGCLNYLSRDELQGVIAHEFSHVLNGDMRLNIRLMGIIFGILVIGQIGYWVMRGAGRGGRVRSSKGKGGGAGVIFLIALALLIIGYIGVFFGNLIQAAVSRTREYLADSSAIQFTRNPAGIGGALKKIGGLADGSRIRHHNAGQASHLFFANGLSGFWSNIFATHPPLDKRIRAIDPGFDGQFPAVRPDAPAAIAPGAVVAAAPAAQVRPQAAGQALRFDSAMLLASVGTPTPAHVAYSAQIIGAIPNQVRLAMLDKNGAQAAMFGLLLSREKSIRENQLAVINSSLPAIMPRIMEIEPYLNAVERSQYLPLCTLAINPLRNLKEADYPLFISVLKNLIQADNRVELFEYMVQRMVQRHLEPRFSRHATPKRVVQSMDTVAPECAAVLSLLAWEGAKDPVGAGENFKKGADLIKDARLNLCPREQCSLQKLDDALNKLDQLVPFLKKELLSACIAVVSADNIISINEVEYIRVVADALECPIPPLIPQA